MMRALTPYSCSSRWATTSNCSWPTAPSSSTLPASGRKTWIAPSSPSWRRPSRSCLVLSGSATSTERNISGAKKGRPVYCRASPSVMVSPSCSTPWLGMPMMSPAKASSSSSRFWLMKVTTVLGRSVLPERTTLRFMPRSKRPEATRTKAMRSRWAGSILAWILNTTPVNLGSSGLTVRCIASRLSGAGASSTRASSTSCTPKLLTAEPKNIGVCRPPRKSSCTNSGAASRTSSISPAALSYCMPKRSA
mmetsp:Transcript_26231/g.62013  ORF Transcript_26231/g.62013 Transcript_26231/m.62013 type:complete len:249 (-) Transcript_26231:1361-2107(-)